MKSSVLNIETKPYSLKELANLYGVCPRTIKGWLRPFELQLGKRIGRFYTKKQVEFIFNQLGHPEKGA